MKENNLLDRARQTAHERLIYFNADYDIYHKHYHEYVVWSRKHLDSIQLSCYKGVVTWHTPYNIYPEIDSDLIEMVLQKHEAEGNK